MIHTPVCDLLQIRHPIVLAGMAGVSSVPLVAAVSNARRWPSRAMYMVGAVTEARRAKAGGADVIVVQGAEARARPNGRSPQSRGKE